MTLASDGLANRLRPILAKTPGIVEKKMFGGIGFMLRGNMAIGTTAKGDLLVRIDPEQQAAALARDGAFQMMMGTREMKGFIAVGASGIASLAELADWVAYALTYTRTLPPK